MIPVGALTSYTLLDFAAPRCRQGSTQLIILATNLLRCGYKLCTYSMHSTSFFHSTPLRRTLDNYLPSILYTACRYVPLHPTYRILREQLHRLRSTHDNMHARLGCAVQRAPSPIAHRIDEALKDEEAEAWAEIHTILI